MNILILGDIVGLSGRFAIKNLFNVIQENKIDFTIVENALMMDMEYLKT